MSSTVLYGPPWSSKQPMVSPPDSPHMSTPGSPYYGAMKPEPIEIIEGWQLNYNRGNAVKYIARAGKKEGNGVKDLEKAISYLRREINTLNGKAEW